jgi:hypothetical protein
MVEQMENDFCDDISFTDFDVDSDIDIDGFDLDFGDISRAVETKLSPVLRYPRPPNTSVRYERALQMAK